MKYGFLTHDPANHDQVRKVPVHELSHPVIGDLPQLYGSSTEVLSSKSPVAVSRSEIESYVISRNDREQWKCHVYRRSQLSASSNIWPLLVGCNL